MRKKEIWTIGHSNRSFEDFLEMLQLNQIHILVDVRHYPRSRRNPHFNTEKLAELLPKHQISYKHLVDLGGRRKAKPDSKNNAWRLASFMGYADYMETENFKNAATELEAMASENRVAYMCAEAVWWSCHRSLISDFLKVKNWQVNHIMSKQKVQEHPFTAPARVVNGKLNYSKEE